MKYNPKIHHRRSVRLTEYDYSQVGAYFLTVCTHQNQCVLGDIVDQKMRLNDIGQQVLTCWRAIPGYWPNVELDEFVIMPNHLHGIIVITESALENPDTTHIGVNHYSPSNQHSPKRPAGTSKTVGSILRGFKTGVTKWMRMQNTSGSVWQRNYYEHIIRDESELFRIRKYVVENPASWYWDRLNPDYHP